jgi:hypothetical protein
LPKPKTLLSMFHVTVALVLSCLVAWSTKPIKATNGAVVFDGGGVRSGDPGVPWAEALAVEVVRLLDGQVP